MGFMPSFLNRAIDLGIWEAVVTNTNGSLPTMGLINLASSFVSFDLDSRIISLSGTPIYIATRAIISALETGSKTPPPDKRSFAPGYFL